MNIILDGVAIVYPEESSTTPIDVLAKESRDRVVEQISDKILPYIHFKTYFDTALNVQVVKGQLCISLEDNDDTNI